MLVLRQEVETFINSEFYNSVFTEPFSAVCIQSAMYF